jgi:hypothetical protein
MNDIERLQHLDKFTARLDRQEAKKEAAVEKALHERESLYVWNKNIKTIIGNQEAEQKALETSTKWLAVSLIFIGVYELWDGRLRLFRWFQRRRDATKKVENEWQTDVFGAPGDGLAQTTAEMSHPEGSLPPLKKRLHAREWRQSDIFFN